ncbi:MAG: sugar ABC transporter substrate-binding protein [Bacteroidetes bacterium]|nr:sugar ABC transporter substrate-binding protein [Bacteroidota bacterium]
MKKKLILVLCLALMLVPFSIFAGAETDGAAEDVNLTVFRWSAGAGRPAYEAALARFEAANPGVTVELSDVPWGEYVDSMVKFQMAGSLPDVFTQYDASIGSFYAMGALLPLDDLLPAGLREEFYPGQWELGVVNGETVGVTFRNGAHVFFYNKDMLRAAGLPQNIIDNGPRTYDEILMAAEACTIDKDGDGTIDQYGYSDNYGDEEGYHQLRSLMMAAGSGPVDTTTFEATMNDAKGVAALQFLVDLNTKGYVPAGSLAKDNNLKKEEFANGLTAMIEGGNWIEATVTAAGLGFDLGVTYVPYPDNIASSQGASAAFVAHSVGSTTEYPELATALVVELSSKEFIGEYCTIQNFLPPRIDVATTDPFYQKGLWPTYIGATTLPKYGALPKHAKVVELSKIMQIAIEKAMMGQSTPKEALDEAAAKWNETAK